MTAASPAAIADNGNVEHEAQARFEEGLSRVKASNFEGARISFAQAYAVLHKPYILWNLALAEEKTGRTLDALAHFRQFESVAQGSDDRASADKHIAELRAEVGRIDVTAPVGAALSVDGASAIRAPLGEPLDVAPGRHHIEVRTPEGVSDVDTDVAAGQVVHVTLPPAPTDAATTSATASAPAAATPPTSSTEASRPREAESAARAPSEPSAARILTTVGVGTAAIVAIATGAYFGLQSQAEESTADGFRSAQPNYYCIKMPGTSTCSEWNGAVQAQNRDATLSNVFYVIGGAFAAGAVATWLLWPHDAAPTRAVRWAPTLVTGGAGIAAGGAF